MAYDWGILANAILGASNTLSQGIMQQYAQNEMMKRQMQMFEQQQDMLEEKTIRSEIRQEEMQKRMAKWTVEFQTKAQLDMQQTQKEIFQRGG